MCPVDSLREARHEAEVMNNQHAKTAIVLLILVHAPLLKPREDNGIHSDAFPAIGKIPANISLH